MGVKGFPTLKIVRPGKKSGRPVVEDYNGARTASGIVEAVVDKINNHVKRVTDKDLDKFLSDNPDRPKAILFTEKGTTSALLRSVAIDFLDVISVAQVRSKETDAVKKFNVEKFPTLILLPGGDKEPVVFEGDIKKAAVVTFLSQAGSPNPDSAPAESKPAKKADKKTEKKAEKKSKPSPKSSNTKPADAEEPTAAEAEAKAEEKAAPPPAPTAEPIPEVLTTESLAKLCLSSKSNTCVLALTPSAADAAADKALTSLADLAFKYTQGKRHLIPFFKLADTNPEASKVRKELGLGANVEVVAINARRSWWRHYEGDFGLESIESWLDAIRMGEGKKQKLPADLVSEAAEASSSTKAKESASTAATEPTPEAETATETPVAETPITHEEL